MSKVHTHNYLALYNAAQHGLEDSCDYYTELFELQARDYLADATSDDVGGVILYYRDGEEIAFFDYENLEGSVYALGGTSADYMPE